MSRVRGAVQTHNIFARYINFTSQQRILTDRFLKSHILFCNFFCTFFESLTVFFNSRLFIGVLWLHIQIIKLYCSHFRCKNVRGKSRIPNRLGWSDFVLRTPKGPDFKSSCNPILGHQKIVSVQYLTDRLIQRVTHQDNLWMIRKLDLTLSEKGTYIKKIQVRGICREMRI